MELFQQLGAEIEALWLEKNYNEEHLPAISADALKRADLPSKLSAWDVVEWSLKQKEMPRQRDVAGRFADPPITIYSGLRFHIDVYFWFEGTTAIHQHGFCGAFQVLMGSSIHSWYEFERSEVVNAFCEIGEMSLKVCEILEVGAVQEIWAGRQYIHSLFHLDQPSATICVRTDRSPLHPPQFSYHKPSLALDPFFDQDTTTKQLQVMSTLFRAKRPDADRLVTEFIEKSDFQTAYMILVRLRSLLGASRMEQMFNLDSPRVRFNNFMDIARKRFGTAGEALPAIFERYDVIDEILIRRGYVTEPEHRFFMALLMNVNGRERILSLVQQRYKDVDPIEKVLDWVFDLGQTRVVGMADANALGIPDFGEAEMFVIEHLLKDKTDAEIEKEFSTANPNADAAAATDAIAKIRGAVIFRPLLA